MIHYFAQTEREDVLLTYIDELYTSKCEQFNSLAPSDCGVSCGDIEDGIAQTHNRIIALLDGAKNTEQQVQPDNAEKEIPFGYYPNNEFND